METGMLSFTLHIPSIAVGFILGYIIISILWIMFSYSEERSTGFGDGYKAGYESAKFEIQESKNGKATMETEN